MRVRIPSHVTIPRKKKKKRKKSVLGTILFIILRNLAFDFELHYIVSAAELENSQI